jgi:hypothetical protein
MSYCNMQNIVLSLYQWGFTLVVCFARYDRRPIVEIPILEVVFDELYWVKGCLGRRRMHAAVIHRLSGGANL